MRSFAALLSLALLGACSEERPAPSPAALPEIGAESGDGRALERKAAFTLRVAADRLAAAVREHAEACRPPACEVTLLRTDLADASQPRGTLQARVQPAAMPEFSARLAASGRVVLRQDSVTDLTAPTLDAEARLGAQRALRDRLRATLAERRDMPLADLLAWEREGARVQGEIEAAETTLRGLSARTATVAVAVGYEGERSLWLPASAAPIEEALRDSLSLLIESVAQALRFLLVALPWIPVLVLCWALLGWLARRVIRRREP